MKSLLAALFPSDCRICQASLFTLSRLPVCPSCVESIQPIALARCNVCGDLLASPDAAFGDARCSLCAATEPAFERAVNYGPYSGVLRQLIHLLKYDRIRAAVAPLARLTAAACLQLEGDIDVEELLMIPVPVHKLRMRSRGFNQAELIARAAQRGIEDATGRRVTLDVTALLRVRFAESQVGLTVDERRQQIRGAFKVLARERVKGREILLVDDVLTTGATASECARELLQAGAARVWVATPARALGRDLSRELGRDAQLQDQGTPLEVEPASLPATTFSNRSSRPTLSGSSFAPFQAGAAQASLRPRRGTPSHGGNRVGWRHMAPARSEDYANGES
ncbi:MAG: ComF family protein [Candidatus Korobacteraceae bacterium]